MFTRLLQLNGLAILGVILFHAAGWGFIAMFAWANRYLPVAGADFSQAGSLAYFLLRFMEQVAVFAIPAFLFVSGIFIAIATPRSADTVGWPTVWARLKGLLIPYLIWSVVVFGLYAVQGRVFSPQEYGVMLLTGKTNPAYYYIPLLTQYYLLSPLLVRLARRWWRGLLIVTGLIQLGVILSYYPMLLGVEADWARTLALLIPKWFFPARIFWFTLGIVVGFHRKRVQEAVANHQRLLLGSALVLIPLGMVEWEVIMQLSGQAWLAHRETLLDSVYALAVIFGFLALTGDLPGSRYLSTLAMKSYGIFIVHSPVMEVVARLAYHLTPWVLGVQALFQPLIIVTGLGVPLLLMALVNRTPARRYYRYLFG
jgi:surface polysaccharide O-acyltransferase-like enzyme